YHDAAPTYISRHSLHDALPIFITPGPQFGGEPFQLYWLWKRCSLPLYKGFLALALDRFIELSVNFAILLGASFYLFSTTHDATRSEEHTSELQSRENIVYRLLL